MSRFIIKWAVLSLISSIAFAEPLPLINPDTVSAGVVGRSIADSPFPLAPKPAADVTTPGAEEATISPEMYKISFVLNKVIIAGNHAFTTAELQKIFTPYIRRKITVAKLQQLVQEVTNKYSNAGYFLSKALLEPQEIRNGVVKVTVVEGFISQIKVQGLKRASVIRFIEKYGNRIKAKRPIKLATLERYLLLMNDVSGFTVKSVLAPDPAVPLGSTLTLMTELKTLDLMATQDNFQTRYLGPDETAVYASLNSFLIPGGTLYTHLLNSNQNRNLQFYELKYLQTLGTDGWLLNVDGYTTKTHPQFVLAPLDVFGDSNDINVNLSYPILRSRQRSFSIGGQFNYMNNQSTALSEELFIDRIRDVTLGFQYNDVLWKGEDNLNISIDKGIDILGPDGPGFRSRFGATNNFFKIMGTASRNQFLGSRFSLYALATAQYSNAILPAAETFIFGGPYLGRGYDWAQFTSDEGIAGKVEFRVNTLPDLRFLKQVQYYVFYDVGKLWSLIPETVSPSGASAGFGLRAMLMKHLNAEGFFGRPLTTPNATQVIAGNSGHAFLGYFQVTVLL